MRAVQVIKLPLAGCIEAGIRGIEFGLQVGVGFDSRYFSCIFYCNRCPFLGTNNELSGWTIAGAPDQSTCYLTKTAHTPSRANHLRATLQGPDGRWLASQQSHNHVTNFYVDLLLRRL
jgi:hypothetical protein